MKNQYFADRNDFYKYDLVLELLDGLGLQAICPRGDADPDDGRCDGGFTNYECGGRRQQLHALLTDILRPIGTRDVPSCPSLFEHFDIECVVVPDSELDDRSRRPTSAGLPQTTGNAVVLLDPDNGLEVKTARGRARAKYVLYEEIGRAFDSLGPDGVLMIYQHLQPRSAYLEQLAISLKERVAPPSCVVASPDNLVAFFVLAKDESRSTDIQKLLGTYNTRVGLRLCERII